MKLSAQSRLELIQSVKRKRKTVARACREAGISRKTFYKWLKRYNQAPSHRKLEALSDKEWKLKRHGKRMSIRIEKLVLETVAENPRLGYESIRKEAAEASGRVISKHAVQNILLRSGLKDFNSKKTLQERKRRDKTTPQERYLIFEATIREGKPIAAICRQFGISRKTYYKWYKRYQETQEFNLDTFENRQWKIEKHPRRVPEETEDKIISLVVRHPELSSHKLAGEVGIGNHGVQNVLARRGLNLYLYRLAYSQAQRKAPQIAIPKFQDRVRYILEQFIPTLAPAPPPSVVTLLKAFGASSFLVFIVFFSFLSWARLLATAPSLSSAIGLIFASMALVMGSFFFLYSFKYYITLALVLSFSQQEGIQQLGDRRQGRIKGFLAWVLGLGTGPTSPEATMSKAVGLTPNLEHIKLKRYPKVAIHVPFYNEKNVVERAIAASTNFDYPGEYEVVLCDDSTDETTDIIRRYQKRYLARGQRLEVRKGEGWTLTQVEIRPGVVLKHLHRTSRSGYKGGALRLALRVTDPKVEFVSIFDADFVPYPDTLELFLKYFQVTTGTLDFVKRKPTTVNRRSEKNTDNGLPITDYGQRIAVVQGYQWHVLNKSENWITRGIRSEYAGSYVIERSGTEIYGGLKMISGAVYMIRRDVLEEVGWETSITEDFQLTLKLYEAGYKVVYTPYIQAPAECVSTLKRLIRQRMRWAEGHSNNVRKMFWRLLVGKWEQARKPTTVNGKSKKTPNDGLRFTDYQRQWVPSPLTISEKLEFLYLGPYYLQAFFFLVGTISWLISETLFPARLPFWTSLWGWSLVLTNMLSLPLMNAVGMFLEESEEKDYAGLPSFIALSYIVVPFQAYAAVKGFFKGEGPWFRTPKTGRITDILKRGTFYRFISGILPGRATPAMQAIGNRNLGTSAQSLIPNAYLSLSTANNQFNNFNLKPKRMRWTGKAGVSLVVLLVLFINYLGLFVQPTQAAAPGGEWWDNNYQYRKKITVTTGANSPSGGYNGYTVRFTIDTATDDAKFLDNCNDLRIARWNGTGWDELVRHVINNDCKNAATDVRFKLAADISASSSDDDYYVYHGYSSAGTPTALGSTNVYLWWDDAASDRESSYTEGRVDDTAHGSAWGNTVAWNSGGYYTYGTGDNYTDSLRPTGLSERDVYVEYEFYHTTGYPTNMTSGPLVRWTGTGSGGTEVSSGHYYYELAWSGGTCTGCGGAYASHDDITQSNRGSVILANGTMGAVTANVWTKVGIASWLINNTNLKAFFDTTPTTAELGGFGATARFSGTHAAASDTETSGQAGVWLQQDGGRVRNILIRRYTEPEPSTELATEEEVPELVLLLLPLTILLPAIVRKFRNGEDLSSFAPNFFISRTTIARINPQKMKSRYKNKDPG